MTLMTDNQKIIIAKRLKELRNLHKYSHETLHQKLKSEGIEISVQSLKDYEFIGPANNVKFKATKGMSIEKLYNLAQFYNVSTDYILGISNATPINEYENIACQYTGLTENAVKKLHHTNYDIENLSKIIEDPIFFELLSELNRHSKIKKIIEHTPLEYTTPLPDIDHSKELSHEEQEKINAIALLENCGYAILQSNYELLDFSKQRISSLLMQILGE